MNYLLRIPAPEDYLAEIGASFGAEAAAPDVRNTRRLRRGSPSRRSSCSSGRCRPKHPRLQQLPRLRLDRDGARNPGGFWACGPAYVSAQLGAWRYGTRTALAPDCMQGVAARLTETDVKAVAAYLATRPAPADSAPATKGAYALPFACAASRRNDPFPTDLLPVSALLGGQKSRTPTTGSSRSTARFCARGRQGAQRMRRGRKAVRPASEERRLWRRQTSRAPAPASRA